MNINNRIPDNTLETTFDPQNLEIKTKSIEQTLVPLVTQVVLIKLQKKSLSKLSMATSWKVINKKY